MPPMTLFSTSGSPAGSTGLSGLTRLTGLCTLLASLTLPLAAQYATAAAVPSAAPLNAATLSIVSPGTMPVNTFIGTQDEGNTFPGASAPFGMIQLSPTGEHYAGWRY